MVDGIRGMGGLKSSAINAALERKAELLRGMQERSSALGGPTEASRQIEDGEQRKTDAYPFGGGEEALAGFRPYGIRGAVGGVVQVVKLAHRGHARQPLPHEFAEP